MKKFEYKTEMFYDPKFFDERTESKRLTFLEFLNQQGADGWEFLYREYYSDDCYCKAYFKRKIDC